MIGPVPPMRLTKLGLSPTALAIKFQCPGGVSELGPSAQNSASTRTKSPRATLLVSYGKPVTGLIRWPVPSLAPSVLLPNDPGEILVMTPSVGVSWLPYR